MKYSDDVVEKVVARLESGHTSQADLERAVGIPRKTLSRWLNRKLAGQPARFKRAAKHVWNRTVQPVLNELRFLLKKGKSTMLAWLEVGKTCLRTVQRYKKRWFPPEPKKREKSKRYERRHALSLLHTDWGVKRILKGKRCCFTFHVDDSSRKLFSLKAYDRATLVNTLDNQKIAIHQTGGFRAVLTDNAKVYRSQHYDDGLGKIHHIKTRPYNPKCNGKAEAVVKKVKRYLSRFVVRDLEHANQLLAQFQREYNDTPHSSLKYRTPNQVFKEKRKNGVISAVT